MLPVFGDGLSDQGHLWLTVPQMSHTNCSCVCNVSSSVTISLQSKHQEKPLKLTSLFVLPTQMHALCTHCPDAFVWLCLCSFMVKSQMTKQGQSGSKSQDKASPIMQVSTSQDSFLSLWLLHFVCTQTTNMKTGERSTTCRRRPQSKHHNSLLLQ